MCLHFKKDESRCMESLSSVIFHKRVMVGQSDSEDSLAELKPPSLSSLLWAEAENSHSVFHPQLGYSTSTHTRSVEVSRKRNKSLHENVRLKLPAPLFLRLASPLLLVCCGRPKLCPLAFRPARPRVSIRASAILRGVDRASHSKGRPVPFSPSNSYFYTCEFVTIICRRIGPIRTAPLFLDAKPSPNCIFTRLRKKKNSMCKIYFSSLVWWIVFS